MMEKEILLAVSAYHLVRAVMCMAARRSRLDPRQLSFTQVLTVVDHAWPKLIAAPLRRNTTKSFSECSIWPLNALFRNDVNDAPTHALHGAEEAPLILERRKTK